MKKSVLSLILLSTVFTSSAFAEVFAKGVAAEKIYNFIRTPEQRIDPNDQESTLVKVLNLTNGGNSIRKGEKGLICEKYVSEKVISEMGTNYICHSVDLTEKN